jgi:hypothetical protein
MPDAQGRMTGPIIVAGLLGGLLGGVASFAASRMIAPAPAAKSESPAQTPVATDARQITDAFMSAVRDGATDQLAGAVKSNVWLISDQEYANFLNQFTGDRVRYAKVYGEPSRQFELVREVALSPSLVRLIYLEKYTRDGILWYFVVYHSQDGWRLVGVTWKEKLAASVSGLD